MTNEHRDDSADPSGTAQPMTSQQAFDRFLETMPARLEAFITGGLPAAVTVGDEEQEFLKDLSPASLPWVEAYAISRLASPALASAPANRRLAEDLMRYVGETFIGTLGGEWVQDPERPDHGMPSVRVGSPARTVSALTLLMTALQKRSGEVFIRALATAAGESLEAETEAADQAAAARAEDAAEQQAASAEDRTRP